MPERRDWNRLLRSETLLRGSVNTRPGPLIWILSVYLSACVGSGAYVSSFDRATTGMLPPGEDDRVFEVYLIGDAGGAQSLDSEPALRLLLSMSEHADSNSAVVFLGDNIYCCGMPDSSEEGREFAEMRMRAQVMAVEDFPGRIFFIPGNHDWGGLFARRVERLNAQERFVESLFGGRNVFLPDDGLPGPIDVKLKDGLRLVLLDTEWWMTESDKPYGESGDADIGEDADFFLELDDLLKRRRHDDIIIAGHHPIRSNGSHGGHFSLKDHVFPLTVFKDWLYVPLPVLGSIYPILRRIAGGPQDFSNPRYRIFRTAMDATIADFDGRLIYASGHEHALQYFSEGHFHQVVSGSGSSNEFVAPGLGARFTSRDEGLMRIRFYADGQIWLEAFSAESEPPGALLYRNRMEEAAPMTNDEPIVVAAGERMPIPDGASTTVAAKPELKAGALKKLFLGSEHRRAWTTEVSFPVFDVTREAGGLTPIKRGGSMQTTSLRLRNEDGKEFVLRSVAKDHTRGLPPPLRRTLAADISVDQMAIMFPYGAVVAAALADPPGIYHANPKYVVVPDDPAFGPYRDVVAGTLMLFEERPDEDMSEAPTFGRSDDVIGSVSMIRKIEDDNDDRVDERHFARSRLFDMLISDWDRHSDQWRWATFSANDHDGKVFKAIPRDRDWSFLEVNGLLPSLAKLPFVFPKIQDFRESYGYLRGLNLNGMYLDRRFTSELTRDDWVEIAEELRSDLSDDDIDRAVATLPDPIRSMYSDSFRRVLRKRRDELSDVADRYYTLLSKRADVVGSNKHERFEVTRLDDDRTEVVMLKTSKEREIRREMYRRVFHSDETKEIRLYGLGGNDTFVFSGSAGKGIRIRAIGGTGADLYEDQTERPGARGSILIYDVPFETEFETGPSTASRISNDPLVNRYNPKEFGYTDFMPTLYPGHNPDDGLFVGAGGSFTLYGFRKLPYASRHTFRGNVSTRTRAFNLSYDGRFVDRISGWDVGISASARTPNNIHNYFGLGNETENTESNAEYYQARFSDFRGGFRFIRPVGGFFEFSIGPTFEYREIEQDTTRFVGQPQSGVSASSFEDQRFAGLSSSFDVDTRDSAVYPRQGIHWLAAAHFRAGLHRASSDFVRLKSEFSVYTSPSPLKSLTFAFRMGGQHVVGAFPFYMASTLGGKETLRGWRSTRFAGRTSLYQNAEIRLSLFRYATLLAVGSAGILGFVDNGRVFTDGERSSAWYQGYGGGFWMNLFDLSVFSGTVGFSKEETTVSIGIGVFY